jgi:hypothetical protein
MMEAKMFKPKGPACQSCGMPINRDPLGGGSNEDGTRTREYCSHCYEKGEFLQPEMTATEMMALVEGKLKSMHIPGFFARKWAQEVPTLRRWRSSKSAFGTGSSSRKEVQQNESRAHSG